MEKKLQVKNLKISFRTTNGKLQAVRNISFDLTKGETLAIVGESGSGKSVTSKAILGILAGNSIVEGGEIIYDGKDLLKISEEEFHKIRGDKIAMIFQDPMSSLNPIVKVGKQLTEAMILKGKAHQKECRRTFNTYLGELESNMILSLSSSDVQKAAEIKEKCKNFDKFEYKHLELEKAYLVAHEAALEAISDIEYFAFELSKKVYKDFKYRVKNAIRLANTSIHKYVVHEKAEELVALTVALNKSAKVLSKTKENVRDCTETVKVLNDMLAIIKEATEFEAPNFFAMGYYLTFSGMELPEMPVGELNKFMRSYLDENFMIDFIENTRRALVYSAEKSVSEKHEAIQCLKQYRPVFEKDILDRKEAFAAHKAMSKEVEETIDKLELVKDSLSYTFSSGIKSEIELYFNAIPKNKKEQKKYDKAKKKYDKIVAKGKTPDYKVPAPSITDFEQVKTNILNQIDRLISHYEEQFETSKTRNFDEAAVAVIDYLKENASGVVTKVTKTIAKNKALKLLQEVGIQDARKRYNQYPFEFSGGMRQRIVIAIALAANPDILICDEPTTALDVTIQSQILELINDLKEKRQLSVIFITHDLGVVANMADRIAVMYAGKIVEYGTSEDVFYHSAHPYTWALLSSMPDLDTDEKLEAIPGTPPNMIYPPVGDAFAARNKYAMQIDFERQPPMFKVSDTHYAATWLLHPDAPKVDPPKAITDRITRMQKMHEKKGANDAE